MEENFATRLKLFMDTIGVASSQFADSCEIPRPSFSQLLSGRNQKVSDVLVKKIHTAFPELSVMWLMFGEGTMLTEAKDPESATFPTDAATDETPKGKNASENPEIRTDSDDGMGYSNLGGLTRESGQAQQAIMQQIEDNKKLLELQLQVENLQKNARRVTQITVYYDDSTFEAFVPSTTKR